MQETLERRATFNRDAFARAVDLVRTSRHLTWIEVAEQSGVPAVTLSRLNNGRALSIGTVAALVAWAGLDARSFIGGGGIAVCAVCGEVGPGGGSHQSLIDCVMALRAHVDNLQRHYS